MFKIFCDFDNTITNKDTIDEVLSEFTNKKWLDIEKLYKNNLLTAKECLEKQIALLKIHESELETYIKNNIKISEGFLDFISFCKNLNYDLTIVSDGLDFIIKTILRCYNINNIPYFSNRLNKDRDVFKIVFPFYKKDCKIQLGCCKCAIVNQYKKDTKIVYIGDGLSDYCISANGTDIIFAKDKLVSFCKENNILHYKFNNFIDIKNKLNCINKVNGEI